MILVALAAVTSGVTMSGAAFLLAATNSGTDLTPYVGAAGNGIAVIGIVFILRAVLSGTLVARPVAEVEAKLMELVESGQAREETLGDIAVRFGVRPPKRPPKVIR